MKHFITIVLCLLLFVGCKEEKKSATENNVETTATDSVDKSRSSLERIEQLLAQGDYRECCDSIKSLRKRFPQAIQSRKRCVEIWDEAQLGIAKDELEKSQSMLTEAQQKMKSTNDHTTQNLLQNEIDEQTARIEAQSQIIKSLQEKIENRIPQ